MIGNCFVVALMCGSVERRVLDIKLGGDCLGNVDRIVVMIAAQGSWDAVIGCHGRSRGVDSLTDMRTQSNFNRKMIA